MPDSGTKRLLALLLCLCLVGGLIPAPAHAQTVGQLCGHHPEHTPDCGYAEASEGSPCTYVCTACGGEQLLQTPEQEPEQEPEPEQQPALFAAPRGVVTVEQGDESWTERSLFWAFLQRPTTDQKVTMTLIDNDPTPFNQSITIEDDWNAPVVLNGGEYSVSGNLDVQAKIDLTITGGKFSILNVGKNATVHLSGGSYDEILCESGTVDDLLAENCYLVKTYSGSIVNATSSMVHEVTVKEFRITEQPQTQKVLMGEMASLSIKTEPSANEGVYYYWKIQDRNGEHDGPTGNPCQIWPSADDDPDAEYSCEAWFKGMTISSDPVKVIGTYLLPNRENPTLTYGTEYDALDYFDFYDDSVKNDTKLSYRLKDVAEDSWKDGSPTNAGVYCVKAAYEYKDESSGKTYTETIDLTIEQAAVSIQWENTSRPYTDSPLAPTAKGVWKDSNGKEHKVDLTVSVTEQEHTLPGTYHAVAGFASDDAANLILPQDCTTTFTIEKAGQGKPVGLVGEAGTILGKGTIQGLTKEMEWAVEPNSSSDPTFSRVTDPDNTFFMPGEYAVRYAETETHNASVVWWVTVPDGGTPLTVTLPENPEHYTITASPDPLGWNQTLTLRIAFEQNYIGTVKVNGTEVPLTSEPSHGWTTDWTFTYTIPAVQDENGVPVSVVDVSPAIRCDDIKDILYDGQPHGGFEPTYDKRIEPLTQSGMVSHYYHAVNGSLPDSSAAPRDVGEYTVDIVVTLDNSFTGTLTGVPFKIVPRELKVEWPTNTTLPYTGSEQAPEPQVTGFIEGDTIQWEVTGKGTDAGSYTASVAFVDGDNHNGNYKLPQNTSCAYTIAKVPQTSKPPVTGEDESISGKGDGKLIGLNAAMEIQHPGAQTYEPVNSPIPSAFPAGTYYVRYAADTNYTASDATTVTIGSGRKLKVNAQNGTGYTVSASATQLDWQQEDVSVTLTYAPHYEGGTIKAKVGEATRDLKLIPGESAKWLIPSDFITDDVEILVEGVKETQPPTGSITVGGRTWSALPETDNSVFVPIFNTATFPTATFAYGDTLSGVATAEYRLEQDKWTLDQLISATGWKAVPDNKSISLKAGVWYLYLKVTDKDGNVTYVGTEQLVVYLVPQATSAPVSCVKADGNLLLDWWTNNVKYSDIGSATMDGGTQSLKGSSLRGNSSDVPYLTEDYLNTLSEGRHTLTLTLDSLLGVKLPSDFTHKTLTLSLDIQKNNSLSVSISEITGKDYDGAPIETPTALVTGCPGTPPTPSFQYRLDGTENWIDGLPADAGTYQVRAVAGDDTYVTCSSEPKEVLIGRKDIAVYAQVENKVEDGTTNATVTKWTLEEEGIVEKDKGQVSIDETKSTVRFMNAEPRNRVLLLFEPVLTGERAPNYRMVPPTDAAAKIYIKPVEGTHYEIPTKANENGWRNTPFTVEALNGYKLSTTDGTGGTLLTEITATDETANGKLIFYIHNTDDTAVSEKVELDYRLDKTAPDGSILLNGNSPKSWYKEAVTLTAQTRDTLSGVASVEYCVSESKTAEGVTSWITLPETGVVISGINRTFYLYVRITDNAGNTSILSSDQIGIDTQAPVLKEVVEGTIADGGIYYNDVTLTGEDAGGGIAGFYKNGVFTSDRPNLTLTFDADKDQTFTVQAVDYAGNRSGEITIHLNRHPFDIENQPEPQTRFYGETATLTVLPSVLPGKTLTYQWYRLDGGNAEPLPGETGNTLVLEGLPSGTSYNYCCLISCEGYEEYTEAVVLTVSPARIYLPEEIGQKVWIDGESYDVYTDGEGKNFVELPDGFEPTMLTSYVFTQDYPDGMSVFRVVTDDETGRNRVEKVEALDNLLNYEGCSIRIDGTPGIRMITGMDQATKTALINGQLEGMEGWTLEEYGTVVQWADMLSGSLTMDNKLGSAYAYKKGTADPIFGRDGNKVLYTNVLVWTDASQVNFARELAMRPYVILSKDGETLTLYGGTVSRSIGHIAQQIQDLNVFPAGSTGAKYVQAILDKAAADQQPVPGGNGE